MKSQKTVSLRVNHDLWKKMKVYCIENETSVQAILTGLLEGKLEEKFNQVKQLNEIKEDTPSNPISLDDF